MIAKELKQQNENIKIVFLCKKLGTSFSEKDKVLFSYGKDRCIILQHQRW